MPDKQETNMNFTKKGIINSAMEKSPEMEKRAKMPEKPVDVPTENIPQTNDKHVLSQENPVPIQCKSVPTQDKPVPAREKTIPSQNKTAPIQCKCVPAQCKCQSEGKLALTQDKLVPTQDKSVPIQDKSVPTQDKSVPSQDKAVRQKPSIFGSPRFPMPSLKKSPHTLYRKLLPAVLFVLTFVTVMTILLIYMDTVALGAAQFRMNMSRDYELARIPQGSAPLVAYVRQLHLAPPPPRAAAPPPAPTPQVHVLDQLYGEIYNGTFIEFLPRGARSLSTLYLERARGWRGVVARAAPRDYLALRTNARAAHACLSPTQHPREVSYSEGGASAVFRSRVLCLPLYTLLLAADACAAEYVLLAGDAALPALTHVPYHSVHIQVIEVQSTDPVYRNKTTTFLSTKNYTVAASFDESVMYALQDN